VLVVSGDDDVGVNDRGVARDQTRSVWPSSVVRRWSLSAETYGDHSLISVSEDAEAIIGLFVACCCLGSSVSSIGGGGSHNTFNTEFWWPSNVSRQA